jgi:hypothetical protein
VPKKVLGRKRAVEQAVGQIGEQEVEQAPKQVVQTQSGRKPVKPVVFEARKN